MDFIKLLTALLATSLVCGLYGAGIRRPFGALPRIPDVPIDLWNSRRRVLIADCIFVAFIVTMMAVLFLRMNFALFLFGSFLFFCCAEMLSYKIKLVPSFYISIALALLAVALVAFPDARRPATWRLI